jgi:hypothetical protein
VTSPRAIDEALTSTQIETIEGGGSKASMGDPDGNTISYIEVNTA